jgi:hypothetical protein
MFDTPPTRSEVTAYHEASHAVAAVKLGVKFTHIEMSVYQYSARQGDIVGGLHLTPEFAELYSKGPANTDDRKKAENLAIVAIAGEAGQARLEQRNCDLYLSSAEGDLEFVRKLAAWLFADPVERGDFIERQKIAACELVSDLVCFRQIESVAMQLKDLLSLTYDTVVQRMDKAGGPGS